MLPNLTGLHTLITIAVNSITPRCHGVQFWSRHGCRGGAHLKTGMSSILCPPMRSCDCMEVMRCSRRRFSSFSTMNSRLRTSRAVIAASLSASARRFCSSTWCSHKAEMMRCKQTASGWQCSRLLSACLPLPSCSAFHLPSPTVMASSAVAVSWSISPAESGSDSLMVPVSNMLSACLSFCHTVPLHLPRDRFHVMQVMCCIHKTVKGMCIHTACLCSISLLMPCWHMPGQTDCICF